MLRKIQDLLFDEEIDDDDIDDEPTEETQTVIEEAPKPAPRPVYQAPAPAPAPKPAPAPEQPRQTTMQRIDVTQNVPVAEPKPAPAPKTESVWGEPEPAKTEKKSLGITLDEKPAEKKPVKPAPAPKPAEKKEKPAKPAYQFQPVISPIFGVDEKDINAVKTTTNKISEQAKARIDKNVSPIISPMYGRNAEESILSVRRPAEQEVVAETDFSAVRAADDEIPEFSLDDILKINDDKYTEEAVSSEANAPLFPDLNFDDLDEEETVVLSKRD